MKKKAGKLPPYDLLVRERREPDGREVTTGVLFVSNTGRSATSALGRRPECEPPPDHRLLVNDRSALSTGPREEWEGLLGLAAAGVVALARVGGEEDAQRAFVLQLLRLRTREADQTEVDLGGIAAAVAEPDAHGLEDADRFIRKAEREKLARKLNVLLHGPAAGLYTGGTPLDLDAMGHAEGPGKTALNVIYLNALADDDQKHFFVAALAAEVYRWMIAMPGPTSGRPRLLFYLDEARDFIPAGTAKPPAKLPLIRLFTQGRKYGVACLLCTQSPRSVDYNVFGNCSTKLVGRLESAQDLERVAEWFGNAGAPPWLAGRKGAEAGSFVGCWPGMPPALEGRAVLSRPLFSLHQGAWSPVRLESERTRAEADPAGT
jgi:hypothetical protein